MSERREDQHLPVPGVPPSGCGWSKFNHFIGITHVGDPENFIQICSQLYELSFSRQR